MRKSITIFKIFSSMLGLVLLITTNFVMQVNATNVEAIEVPDATKEFYVNDFAKVFTDAEKQKLMDKAVDFSEETDGVQVVVTTVKSLEGNTIEDYANEMYNQYKIGKNDMGILILLSTGDRQIRVEIGRGLEQYINAAKAGRFIDNYAIPYLKKNKFNEGLINLQKVLISEIGDYLDKEKAAENQENIAINIENVFCFLASCVCVGILVLSELKRNFDKQKEEMILNYQKLNKEYSDLIDKYARIKKLHPNIEEEILEMIEKEIKEQDMKKAQEVDSLISEVINCQVSKDIVSKLYSVLESYSDLEERQKIYIKSDIDKLNQLYNASVKLKEEKEEEERREIRIRIDNDYFTSGGGFEGSVGFEDSGSSGSSKGSKGFSGFGGGSDGSGASRRF